MNKLFLISSDDIDYSEIKDGSISLSSVWGGELDQFSCEESPYEILNNLTETNGLILLKGDSAQKYSSRGSWLEALGDWQQPVVMLVRGSNTGQTPGFAYAYSALCKELSVKLIALLQIGGVWDMSIKVHDNLPWCGLIPSRSKEVIENLNSTQDEMNIRYVAHNIRKKLTSMSMNN